MRRYLLVTAAALSASFGLATNAAAQSASSQAPGTITVRLNGRVDALVGASFQSDFNTPGNKLDQDVGVGSFMRLYPAFDGVAANGLKYGAKIELRQDNGAGNPVTASPSGQSYSRGAVYVRRAYGYVGTDQLGTLRFGQTDGVSSLFLTGTYENFNDGGWNATDSVGMLVSNAQLTWPFADVGNMYASEKLVYLSPQFYGFDFGVSYEPTTNGSSTTPGCDVGGTGCMLLSSTNGADYNRRRNTIDIGARYRGAFGPVGLAANGDWIHSGKVGDASGEPISAYGLPGTRFNYDGLDVGEAGLTLTYAGFSAGGAIQFGRFNGSWQLLPKGQADALAWIAGASYTAGPLIVGASYINYKSAGDPGITTGQRDEQGIAVGGTYTLAPGLALYLSYLWDQRKEGGYDFVTAKDDPYHNQVQAQFVGLGSMITW